MGNTRASIKVLNGALDEVEGGSGKQKEIILRGVIDPDSLQLLQFGSYQREVLPLPKIDELRQAYERGASVPDIDCGIRGWGYDYRNGCYYLFDPVFVVDGQQRVNAALRLLQKGADRKPHVGATFHFGSTEEWERGRFRILNAERTKLSPNVLLRNLRSDMVVIEDMYRLTTSDRSFVLCARVCWDQRMRREHLLSALTFLKTTGALHSHLGPGRSNSVDEVAAGLQKILDAVGPQVFRANVRTFFEIMEECWGIKIITFKEGAAYLRSTFLICLALLFSRHEAFWYGNRLRVERDLRRKLRQFPVQDPQVRDLASSSGKAGAILYQLLVEHLNSGKRTHRLIPREVLEVAPADATTEPDGERNSDS